MSEFTHIFIEQGNGFPGVGDDVIVGSGNGWSTEIMKIIKTSPIFTDQTGGGGGNYIYLVLGESDADWSEMDEGQQDRAWEDLYHVSELDEEV